MKIFFAGSEAGSHEEILRKKGVKNYLYSYFYVNKSKSFLDFEGLNVFIDSGGYSARIKDIDIDVYAFGEFLAKHKDKIFAAANLDVNDIETQLSNQKILEQYYPVLPVFHLQDYANKRQDLLVQYLEKYPYIALGGMVGASSKHLEIFLNYCFSLGLKKKVKYHGFGLTSSKFLMQYPFYSVDSTSWLGGGRYGTMQKWDAQTYKMKSSIHYKDRDRMLENRMDFEAIGDYFKRLENDIDQVLKMETQITELWKKRGIIYN